MIRRRRSTPDDSNIAQLRGLVTLSDVFLGCIIPALGFLCVQMFELVGNQASTNAIIVSMRTDQVDTIKSVARHEQRLAGVDTDIALINQKIEVISGE